jgi:pimeloyl-ACP methyl ester carboxylesterase
MKVSIGDVRLWFDVLNAGLVPEGRDMRAKPVLVALHGGPGSDHSGFKGVLDPLCDVAQIVMYDHRGNGRSDDGDPALWTVSQWTDDVHAFCAALGIERPFVLGWSFGGMIAQSYAARFPDEPAGLILLSTATRISWDQFGPAFERLGGEEAREAARYLVEPTPENREEFMRICMPLYTYRRDPEYLIYSETRPVARREVTRHFFGDEAWRMDLEPGLAAITCPTLVLNGLHDPITPPECSDILEAGLVNADVTRVTGRLSSHDLPVDEPELFERAVRDFLTGCSAPGGVEIR